MVHGRFVWIEKYREQAKDQMDKHKRGRKAYEKRKRKDIIIGLLYLLVSFFLMFVISKIQNNFVFSILLEVLTVILWINFLLKLKDI